MHAPTIRVVRLRPAASAVLLAALLVSAGVPNTNALPPGRAAALATPASSVLPAPTRVAGPLPGGVDDAAPDQLGHTVSFSAPRLVPAPGDPEARRLRWTETFVGSPSPGARTLVTRVATTSPGGCTGWRTARTRLIAPPDDAAPPVLTSARPASTSPQVQRVAVEAAAPAGAMSNGHCYRWTVRLAGNSGPAGSATSAVVVVGARDAAGRPLPAWTGATDLYRPSAFVTQRTWKWCVAAAAQMMVNLVVGSDDRSYRRQRAIIDYAHRVDGLKGAVSNAGTSAAGWRAAVQKFTGARYEVLTYRSFTVAVRVAALRIRLTGRPVGILVMDGAHAWVLHGFSAASDPAADPRFEVDGVDVSGPLYPHETAPGYDRAPDTYLSTRDLAAFWTPLHRPGQHGYVLVAPGL